METKSRTERGWGEERRTKTQTRNLVEVKNIVKEPNSFLV